MYLGMAGLGHAAESTDTDPTRLDGDPKGAGVLVLGAGMAGMVAAMEPRGAGYRVKMLEYNDRAGGRAALDGRILLAGEHASYLPAWQEGAALSALDAVRFANALTAADVATER